MRQIIATLYFLLITLAITHAKENPPFTKYSADKWVDSLMQKMTIDQKIGQLFMIQAYSNKNEQHFTDVLKQISQFEVGGVIFMQGGPVAQAKISNKLQQASPIPLLVAIDAETGLGFRLDSTLNYPVQMALGAIESDTLIYRMGYEIGKQCRMIGVHMNMAPVSDININHDNPIINYRSFGEDKKQVARKSWLYASGMQDAGVLATAKHFPGHGDTQIDSHHDLPVIKQTKVQLDSLEMFPFSYLIKKGIGAIMTGHLQVPALEANKKLPATLSSNIIQKKLRNELGFSGLVITDAMNMKGVSNLYSSAESTVKALKAGNDMVEIVPRLDRAIAAVKQAVATGELSVDEIDEKCRKILTVKKWLGLDQQKFVKTDDLYNKLNENRFQLTKRLLQEQSLTVLANKQDIIPLKYIDRLKIASVAIGSEQTVPFQNMLANYTGVDFFNTTKTLSEEESISLMNQLKPYNLLIISVHGTGLYPFRRFGISDQQIKLIEKLKGQNSIVCFFGNPYAMQHFPEIWNAGGLIVAYQDNQEAQELSAQLIFGAIGANGKLPVKLDGRYPMRSGIEVKPIGRLKYTLPEEVKINAVFLKSRIDSLAKSAIADRAFPGCQVLVAKDGKIIFNQSYGYFTYENEQAVTHQSLFDLASITKITAPLPVIMKLYDEKKIALDAPFSNYFDEFKKTNKSAMTIRDLLTHQAQLQSGLPFWIEPGSRTQLRKEVFENQPSEKFQVRVATELYARNDIKDLIIKDIIRSPLRVKKEFHYSDLGFGLFPTMIERVIETPFQEYLNNEFLKPLGAFSTRFKPYEQFPLAQIAPTENDQTFRKELLHGFVHDELAALLGGISGNAGLFSTANDLAKIMQMFLQTGYYGGKQYISPRTINEFTKVQFPQTENRRALGFDKPNPGIKGLKNRFPAADASPSSFGHTGFTGTFTWADPGNNLLFIFLSNRVHPTRRNLAISSLNIRTKMHQAVYDAIKRGDD
jgi:beta-N-acetylhexosaminidase